MADRSRLRCAALALGATGLLAACGSGAPAATPSATPSASPSASPSPSTPTSTPSASSSAGPSSSAPSATSSTPRSTPAPSSSAGGISAPHVTCATGPVSADYAATDSRPAPLCLTQTGSAELHVTAPPGQNWTAADAAATGPVTIRGVVAAASALTISIAPHGQGTATVAVHLGGRTVWTVAISMAA